MCVSDDLDDCRRHIRAGKCRKYRAQKITYEGIPTDARERREDVNDDGKQRR
jgi:hypothetical protein